MFSFNHFENLGTFFTSCLFILFYSLMNQREFVCFKITFLSPIRITIVLNYATWTILQYRWLYNASIYIFIRIIFWKITIFRYQLSITKSESNKPKIIHAEKSVEIDAVTKKLTLDLQVDKPTSISYTEDAPSFWRISFAGKYTSIILKF